MPRPDLVCRLLLEKKKHQNVRATRASVTSREDDVAGKLMLDINVELLDAAEFEVGVLRLDSSGNFFFNDTAPNEIYTLSLHDALPIYTLSRHSFFRSGLLN